MKRTIIFAIVAASALLVSCNKESRELMYANQESNIEKFVNKLLETDPEARVIYNGGATRVVMAEGEGVELTARGRASILYAGYNFKTGSVGASTLFVTNNGDYASSVNWTLSDDYVFEALEMDMTDKGILQGLRDGLEGVRAGEECYILFSGKYAFGKSNIGTIPANSPLAFRVWVLSVEN